MSWFIVAGVGVALFGAIALGIALILRAQRAMESDLLELAEMQHTQSHRDYENKIRAAFPSITTP